MTIIKTKHRFMINYKLFIWISLTFIAVSCDYEGDEYYYINNKTNLDIKVSFVKKYGNDKKDTTKISVLSNETRNFYTYKTIAALTKQKGENYLDVFDTLWISINDTLTLNKDLYKIDNWDYSHQGSRDVENKYTFMINNNDIRTR